MQELDHATPVLGFRNWLIDPESGRLFSVYVTNKAGQPYEWTTRSMVAECLYGGTHEAPDPSDGCGLYVWHIPADAQLPVSSSRLALIRGVARVADVVLVHNDGARAREASVFAFVKPADRRVRKSVESLAYRWSEPGNAIELVSPDALYDFAKQRGRLSANLVG